MCGGAGGGGVRLEEGCARRATRVCANAAGSFACCALSPHHTRTPYPRTLRFLTGELTERTVWAGFDSRAMAARTAAVRAQVLAEAGPDDPEAKEYLRVDALMQQLAAPLR